MKKAIIIIAILIIIGLIAKNIKSNKPEMEKIDWLQGQAVFKYKGKLILFDFNSGNRELEDGYEIITNKTGDKLTVTQNSKVISRWSK